MGFLPRRGVPAGLVQPGTVAGQILVWNGAAWVPITLGSNAGRVAADVIIIGGTGWGNVYTLNVQTFAPSSRLFIQWDYTRYSTAGGITEQRATVDGVMVGGTSIDPTTYSHGSFARLSGLLTPAVHVVNLDAQLPAGGNYHLDGTTPAGYYGELTVFEVVL